MMAVLVSFACSKSSSDPPAAPGPASTGSGGDTAGTSTELPAGGAGSQLHSQEETTNSAGDVATVVDVPWRLRGVGADSDAWDCDTLGVEWSGLVSLPPSGGGLSKYSSASCDPYQKQDLHAFDAPIPGTYGYEVTLFRGPFSDFESLPLATRSGTIEVHGGEVQVEPIVFVFQKIPVEWAFAADAGALDCESLGVSRVAFGFKAGRQTRGQVLPCELGQGAIHVEAGTYEFSVELQDVNRNALYRWVAPQPVVISDSEPSTLPAPVFQF